MTYTRERMIAFKQDFTVIRSELKIDNLEQQLQKLEALISKHRADGFLISKTIQKEFKEKLLEHHAAIQRRRTKFDNAISLSLACRVVFSKIDGTISEREVLVEKYLTDPSPYFLCKEIGTRKHITVYPDSIKSLVSLDTGQEVTSNITEYVLQYGKAKTA